MKSTTLFHLALELLIVPFFFSFPLMAPQQVRAQDSGYLEPSEKYSREDLAQMLAPIALYPDALLSQVLMASTYPIEVIEADRWVRDNPGLQGEALDRALLERDWDPSVKAICHFPSILSLMSERISESTDLGNAFLAQEAEVMDMVQDLRARAYAQGHLVTNSRQKVIVEKETIIIQPAYQRVIYVPYYDPFTIYGPWWYPAYPPWYWGPPRVRIGIGISYWPGSYFQFAFGTWSYFDWPHRHIFIDVHRRPRFVSHDRWIVKSGRWHHAPHHRRGLVYRDASTTGKYGRYLQRSREFQRNTRDFREGRVVDRDRSRGTRDRTRIDRERSRVVRPPVDPNHKGRQRVERDRQIREQGAHNRQERQRVERERQSREQTAHDRQEHQRVERDRQVHEGVARDRQKRQRIEPERGKQAGVERLPQTPQRSDQAKGVGIGGERQRRIGDTVSSQAGNVRGED